MAKKPSAAPDDPVEEARASGEKRRADFAAEQEDMARKLDAIREEGRLQRERDQEEHDKAVLAEAEAAAKARVEAADAERAEIEQLYEAAKKAKAERDEEADRAFAELLAARREAEKDTDPSLGPQMTLDKRGLFAKAARGGIAGTMAGNLDALSIATAEEAQP